MERGGLVAAVQFLAESLMQEDNGASSDNTRKTKKDTVNAELEMSFRRTKMEDISRDIS